MNNIDGLYHLCDQHAIFLTQMILFTENTFYSKVNTLSCYGMPTGNFADPVGYC